MEQIPNYILCSHHPKERNTSPCASIYQLFIGKNRIKDLSGFIYIMDSEENISKSLNSLGENIEFLFNGYKSLVQVASLKVLTYAWLHDIPITIYWHETSWNLRAITRDSKISLNILQLYLDALKVTNFVPTSQCMHSIITAFGFSFETFRIVFEVFDISKFTPSKKYFNPSSVIFCGAGLPNIRKGIDIFAELAFEFKNKNQSYIFKWYAASANDKLPKNLMNLDMIDFCGHHTDFHEKLQEIDIFILTSRDDPSPLVALEALACNKPVFAFSSTGYVEILPEEFIANTPLELMKKIEVYLKNIDTYDALFFRKIAEKFTPELFIHKAFPEGIAPTAPVSNSSLNCLQQVFESKLTDKEIFLLRKSAQLNKSKIKLCASKIMSLYKEIKLTDYIKTLAVKKVSFFQNTKVTKKKILVIGNAPSVIDSKLGYLIDSFDIVIRINNFVIKGYEEYIGSKISFVVISPVTFHSEELSTIKSKQILLFSANFKTYDAIHERIMRANGCKICIVRENILDNNRYFKNLSNTMGLLPTQWPTTGTVAIQWAIDYFKQPIHVHGFDFSIGESGRIEHYFPHSTIQDSRHDFLMEAKRFQLMLKNNEIIKL